MSNSYKGSFGFSAEVQRRQAEKYDVDMENMLREWIEDRTGTAIGGADFAEGLKSGVILCRLLNQLQPKTVKGINKKAKMPFHCMENISKFLNGCRALGVPEHSMFSTVDLYEAKNMSAVLLTLDNLLRQVSGRTEPVERAKATRCVGWLVGWLVGCSFNQFACGWVAPDYVSLLCHRCGSLHAR